MLVWTRHDELACLAHVGGLRPWCFDSEELGLGVGAWCLVITAPVAAAQSRHGGSGVLPVKYLFHGVCCVGTSTKAEAEALNIPLSPLTSPARHHTAVQNI